MCSSCFLAALLSGNFWVYPDPIAKGWDASLAYLPYQQMRREMNCFIDAEGIDYAETATSFPSNIALKYLDLSDDARSFATIGGILASTGIFSIPTYSTISPKNCPEGWKKNG